MHIRYVVHIILKILIVKTYAYDIGHEVRQRVRDMIFTSLIIITIPNLSVANAQIREEKSSNL